MLFGRSPVIFFFLRMPEGVCYGAVTSLVPFLITRAGLPVSVAASVTAIAVLPYVMAALCGPVIDLTLTLKHWYWIGLLASATGIILVGAVPIRHDMIVVLTTAAFLGETGATLISVSVGSLIARTVSDSKKGRAGGWYQAGLLAGAGLGGGGGIWLATHQSPLTAAFVLAGLAVACATALRFVAITTIAHERECLRARLHKFKRDLLGLVRCPEERLVTVLVISPIGIGAATNLWAAIALDWHAVPNLIAFATGVVSGLAAAAGCLVGGWTADRIGRWTAFFGSGLTMALVGLLMAAAPRTSVMFTFGILLYAFSQGMANAAFSALVLRVVAQSATKYALLMSFGNFPVSYMTVIDGVAHDHWGAGGMLIAEALLGAIAAAIGLSALRRIRLLA